MDPIEIGKKIRAARGDETQEDLARAINVSKAAVAMYESGQRVPRDEVKIKIAQKFGTTVGAFFYGE